VRALIRVEVEVDVPADQLWSYVTDWPRQAEWVPLTRVERVDPDDPATAVGGRIRAWTGLGPLGFWDPMTITAWDQHEHGGGRCEVLHTGSVVRGEGEFEVVSTGPGSSRFLWAEMAVIPFGRVGALAWRLAGPIVEHQIGGALATMKAKVEGTPYDGH
jgi:hypothetical protein